MKSAEARKPKNKVLRVLKGWGSFSLIQLEFSNFYRPSASVSCGDEQKKGSCVGMYEPKTFTSLAAIVQRNRKVAFLAALGDGEEPEGIFS